MSNEWTREQLGRAILDTAESDEQEQVVAEQLNKYVWKQVMQQIQIPPPWQKDPAYKRLRDLLQRAAAGGIVAGGPGQAPGPGFPIFNSPSTGPLPPPTANPNPPWAGTPATEEAPADPPVIPEKIRELCPLCQTYCGPVDRKPSPRVAHLISTHKRNLEEALEIIRRCHGDVA